MIKNKKLLLLSPALIALMLLLGACGGTDSNGDASSEDRDTLIVAVGGNINSMDLHGTNDIASTQVHRQIFETLVFQDENMDIHPGLAHDWRLIENSDRVWEFDLLEDVYFHNGERMTAYDVAFTMDRASRSPHVAAFLDIIDADTIEVIDDNTIRIGTHEPFAPFLSHLAHPSAGIMNEMAVEEAGDDVDREPIGTGPFKFVSWAAGDRIVIERFDGYHGESPQMREITFRMISDGQARTMAIETGDVDIALSPLPVDLTRLEENDNVTVVNRPGLSVAYMGLSDDHEHLSNSLVRQAISYAVDNTAIVNAAFEGRSNVATTPITPDVFGFNPDVEMFPHDVERARELMIEAGLEDGFSFTITVNSENQQRVEMATMVRNQLQEINIDAEIHQLDWPTFLDDADNGRLESFFMGWIATTGDADYALFPSFHSTSINGGGNSSLFANDRVDELLELARVSTDDNERIEAYHEVQVILREEAPWVLFNRDYVFVAMRNNVRGFEVQPSQAHFFGNVYFE